MLSLTLDDNDRVCDALSCPQDTALVLSFAAQDGFSLSTQEEEAAWTGFGVGRVWSRNGRKFLVILILLC